MATRNVANLDAAMYTGRPSKHGSMGRVSRRSLALCGAVYAMAGIFGYVCFLSSTKPDLLNNFQVSGATLSPLMDVLRLGFGFALIFSYPIVVWEARHMLVQECSRESATNEAAEFNAEEAGGSSEHAWLLHVLLNLSIVGSTTVLGVFTPSVLEPLHFIGATCSPLIVFILPALIFRKLQQDGSTPAPQFRRQQQMAGAILLFGVALIPVATTVTIVDLLSK
jgi:amino acid permease